MSTNESEMRTLVERVLAASYEIDCEIGRGGMGIVYSARDRRLKRIVAIKVLPPELAFRSDIRSRFLREAETAAGLNHPNIVDIYSVDEAEGLVYFVMAYISGDNLAKRLHDQGPFSPEETRRIICDVADALDYAHGRGVVHRDIKPDNIILDGDSERPMVTDFGIARAAEGGDSRLTATGMAIGTPAYMSPEQAAGEREIDGRSDVYSLGVVAYQMLTGEPPFTAASTPAMLVKHLSERPTPVEQRRAGLPTDLSRAIMMCLEKDPANRFPSAGALKRALESGELGDQPPARTSGAAGSLSSSRASGSSTSYPLATYTRGDLDAPYLATADDWRRWESASVVRFRRKLAPYLFVNAVIVIASLVGSTDFFGITVIWSIYIAYRYAKLWTDGYDWRDVFRQPRDRELIDVADDLIEQMRALFNADKRRELREKRRERAQQQQLSPGPMRGFDPPRREPVYGSLEDTRGGRAAERSRGLPMDTGMGMREAGNHGRAAAGSRGPDDRSAAARDARGAGVVADGRVRQAFENRDRILRLLDQLPKPERERLSDVRRSAIALADRVEGLSASLEQLGGGAEPGSRERIEQEIARLEAEANPFDEQGSLQRTRRLSLLRRQLRAVADIRTKSESIAAKLDTCVIALENMKLDLLRLRAGEQTHQHVTDLALRAMSLADSVDSALYVADEMDRLGVRTGSERSPGARR